MTDRDDFEFDTLPDGMADLVAAGRREAQAWKRRRAEISESPAVRPPVRIGPYKIIRRIGVGGMGVVYEAEQAKPSRRVAVKVIRDSERGDADNLRLFQREIHILGRLHHPAIAQIYDAGQADDGQQYYVMELVDGRPLVEYCDLSDLPLRARLKLFVQVCDAVQYAHQRGVIHRDLKPANILVDREGLPRVLDFGLARVVDPGMDATRSLLAGKELVGTLPYMSPEQTQCDPGDLDTRTDVYSLGVVLYEMLTGTYPYDVKGKLFDVIHNIAQTPPAKPASSTHKINDELATIVLRALAKEQDRRYQSAETFGKDVHHFLHGEPIDAKRDSAVYVLRKLVARQMRAVVTVGLILFAGVAVVAAGWSHHQASALQRANMFLEARESLDRGDYASALDEVEQLREAVGSDLDVELLRARALLHLRRFDEAKRVLFALQEEVPRQAAVYDLLAQVVRKDDPKQSVAYAEQAAHWRTDSPRDYYLRSLTMDDHAEAADCLTAALDRDPDLFEALMALCSRHYCLGDYRAAVNDAQRAQSLRPHDAATWHNLGSALIRLAYQEGAADVDAGAGSTHARRAVTVLTRAVAIKPEFPEAWSNLGQAHALCGAVDEARDAFQRAVALDPHNPRAWRKLGRTMFNDGDYDGATSAYEQAHELRRDHVRTVVNLALCHEATGRYDDALVLLDRLLAARPDHVDALRLAAWIQLTRPDQPSEDLTALERAARAGTLRPADPACLTTWALAELQAGRYAMAYDHARQSMAQTRDPWNLSIGAWAATRLGQREEAQRLWDEAQVLAEEEADQDRALESFLGEVRAQLLSAPDATTEGSEEEGGVR